MNIFRDIVSDYKEWLDDTLYLRSSDKVSYLLSKLYEKMPNPLSGFESDVESGRYDSVADDEYADIYHSFEEQSTFFHNKPYQFSFDVLNEIICLGNTSSTELSDNFSIDMVEQVVSAYEEIFSKEHQRLSNMYESNTVTYDSDVYFNVVNCDNLTFSEIKYHRLINDSEYLILILRVYFMFSNMLEMLNWRRDNNVDFYDNFDFVDNNYWYDDDEYVDDTVFNDEESEDTVSDDNESDDMSADNEVSDVEIDMYFSEDTDMSVEYEP